MKKLFFSTAALTFFLVPFIHQEVFSSEVKDITNSMKDDEQQATNRSQALIIANSIKDNIEQDKITPENASAKAEKYQNAGDIFLSQKKYADAASLYVQSLETVFDNYDLHCFLKKIGFDYYQVANIKNDSNLKNLLVQELAEKMSK